MNILYLYLRYSRPRANSTEFLESYFLVDLVASLASQNTQGLNLPCIMCVQHIGGVHVIEVYHDLCGGYQECIRGYSVHRGVIMTKSGDTMSTSAMFISLGGFHDTCGRY